MAETPDPHEVVQYQVKKGQTALLGDHAYGDRATLQLTRREAAPLVKAGTVEEVAGPDVPDVATRPDVPPPGSRKP